MFKADAFEAAPIMQRAMTNLLTLAPTRGQPGADLRRACGDMIANAELWIQNDIAGLPLAECYDLAQKAGATINQLAYVRTAVEAEAPLSVGALMIKNSIIQMSLATEASVISRMTFVSRDDVDALKPLVNTAFEDAEEIAADDMDQMSYRALVALHAAVMFFLAQTARPLPRMLNYAFYNSMPTLVLAQRLYYDAGRADELRDENHVVHPAFTKPEGRALSA
jgi:prophage DNA circulation protein